MYWILTVLSSSGAVQCEGLTWHDPSGGPVLNIERAKGRTRFIFDEKLAELYADFSARRPTRECQRLPVMFLSFQVPFKTPSG